MDDTCPFVIYIITQPLLINYKRTGVIYLTLGHEAGIKTLGQGILTQKFHYANFLVFQKKHRGGLKMRNDWGSSRTSQNHPFGNDKNSSPNERVIYINMTMKNVVLV